MIDFESNLIYLTSIYLIQIAGKEQGTPHERISGLLLDFEGQVTEVTEQEKSSILSGATTALLYYCIPRLRYIKLY